MSDESTKLAEAVAATVAVMVAAGRDFSAYDVTKSLKLQYTQSELFVEHKSVRLMVHAVMVGHVMSGRWSFTDQQFPDGTARVYTNKPTNMPTPVILPRMTDITDSSAIDSIGYDRATGSLFIGFVSGDIYKYANVTQDNYIDLMAAASRGKFYHANIRGQFNSVQVH
jgi:hypothetical protein